MWRKEFHDFNQKIPSIETEQKSHEGCVTKVEEAYGWWSQPPGRSNIIYLRLMRFNIVEVIGREIHDEADRQDTVIPPALSGQARELRSSILLRLADGLRRIFV
jgi:hypothetical protein